MAKEKNCGSFCNRGLVGSDGTRTLEHFSFTVGTIASYDFGSFGRGYPVPGTVQIQAFTLKPGDMVPWHYHKVLSYVILARGTLTETHVVAPGECHFEELSAGSAFRRDAWRGAHRQNTGNDAAVVWWSTVFPQSDGIARFVPQFESGGIHPVEARRTASDLARSAAVDPQLPST